MEEGFIKIFRKMLKWEWFSDSNTVHVFIYCLLRANWEDTSWKGIEIKRGEFITSYKSISDATGLTVQQVRTALNHLKSTQELTISATRHKFSKIKVLRYDEYQQSNKIANNELTTNQQRTNNELTIDKNNKNNKNNKNIYRRNKFNNCEARIYDFDELERRLTN